MNDPIRVRLSDIGEKMPLWRNNFTLMDAEPLNNSATLETHYLPLYCVTGFFAVIGIVVPFFIKGPDRWIYKSCVVLAAFCMWLLWVTIYIAQMNPIIGPRITNETLIWIAYRWGDPMTLSDAMTLTDDGLTDNALATKQKLTLQEFI